MLWLEPKGKQWIEERDWTRLRGFLGNRPLPEVADLLQGLGKVDHAFLFHALPRETSTEVFAYLDGEEENALWTDLTDEEMRELQSRLRPDDRTDLFEELPGQATQKLLNLLSPEDLREAHLLLGCPEESVG